MLKDIYCKTVDDPLYESNKLEVSDPTESLIGKIKMILYTKPGEILGMPSFGVDLEKALFEFGLNNGELSAMITNQINIHIPESGAYDINVRVTFVPGSVRDAAFIDIYIDGVRALGISAK